MAVGLVVSRKTEIEALLGYEFSDFDLVEQALSHTSWANETKSQSNQRLEFLGDAVLEVIVSQYFFHRFPDDLEGQLTTKRVQQVRTENLANVARDLGLPDYLKLGKGEKDDRGEQKDSILADTLEAVIAAVYLDGGMKAAEKFVTTFVINDKANLVDVKGKLQAITQSRFGVGPVYSVTEKLGPEHQRSYTVEVSVRGKVWATGHGTSRKLAEKDAAQKALESA